LLSRPTVREVVQYRKHVDQHVLKWLESETLTPEAMGVVALGLNHEQQHQELMLTDIKHVLSRNPLFPVYSHTAFPSNAAREPSRFVGFVEGLYEIGHAGTGFAYDNESPRHRVFVNPFCLSDRLVTAGEYLDFIADGGYRQPRWWLSLGWQTVTQEGWEAPLYWREKDGRWFQFTLAGLQPINPDTPVCHVSYFEAEAYARWANARLPSEAEWEIAANTLPVQGNFADQLMASGLTVHPAPCQPSAKGSRSGSPSLSQMFGDAWEWTYSPYMPYPGYAPADGAIGEYNGKFMCGQYVLRGGSCATPSGHLRRTYRNFFPPSARWQFSGIRLARDLK
jgi:ergothioneine biosynthesis protein EgtB